MTDVRRAMADDEFAEWVLEDRAWMHQDYYKLELDQRAYLEMLQWAECPLKAGHCLDRAEALLGIR